MARLPTCPDCGIDIKDKSKATKKSNRWVCADCIKIREQIKRDREELYMYTAKIFNIKFPTGMMMKQIKDFREEFGYTYKGMTLSLQYWCESLGNTMSNAKGVGIIPYIYEDAKAFYKERMNVKNAVEDIQDPLMSEKTVTVHKQKPREDNMDLKLIDMNDL